MVQLTKEPRAEAYGVIVDSDLEIQSERAAFRAGRLPVCDSADISGRRTFLPERLELCHRSHERFPKMTLCSSSSKHLANDADSRGRAWMPAPSQIVPQDLFILVKE